MGRTACTEPQCLYKGALILSLTDERDKPTSSDLSNKSGRVSTGKILFTPLRLTKMNYGPQDVSDVELYYEYLRS